MDVVIVKTLLKINEYRVSLHHFRLTPFSSFFQILQHFLINLQIAFVFLELLVEELVRRLQYIYLPFLLMDAQFSRAVHDLRDKFHVFFGVYV